MTIIVAILNIMNRDYAIYVSHRKLLGYFHKIDLYKKKRVWQKVSVLGSEWVCVWEGGCTCIFHMDFQISSL